MSDFADTIQIIAQTKAGQEAAMYPAIRDLLAASLGYEKKRILTDIAGDAGRPDVTVRAASGLLDKEGKDIDIDWIVVEAKDEHDAFSTEAKREAIFATKSKYVTPNTAWFLMVDPTVIVARPTFTAELTASNDLIFKLDGTADEAAFRKLFSELAAERAGVPERLLRFRQGDTTQIASEKLTLTGTETRKVQNQVRLARQRFYSALRDTTKALQDAAVRALNELQPTIQGIEQAAEDFGKRFGGYEFEPYTLTITGHPENRDQTKLHGSEAAKLNRWLRRQGAISRLALHGLPEFRARTGTSEDAARATEMFAIETANLILARILLIRFFEDHQFFGPHRYVCNGGVQAFQMMRQSFDLGYTSLLKEAYDKAKSLYAAAFDETELDWVFSSNHSGLSAAIEWAMYQLSRYDFTTVKGDILTGVYDRFLEPKQRKRLGEFFTPPSIARYIIDRLELSKDDRLLDPACGSGTFLIERYQQLVGEDADKGIATYAEAQRAISTIAGADLNTFSAVLAQIQLLWHVLVFQSELKKAGEFPDILIADKVNSLTHGALDVMHHNRFVEIDHGGYGGVAGNPPYVRPERAGELDKTTALYFETARAQPGAPLGGWNGISSEANLYALFVYRALDSWCRSPDAWGLGAGRLGFVLPLALCGTQENSDLRRLFGPGGRWTIKEIVDLEVIWRHIFDADVLPMILIAEARPPRLPMAETELELSTGFSAGGARSFQARAARLDRWMNARLVKATERGDEVREAAWRSLIKRNGPRFEPDRVTIRLADKSCIHFEGGGRPTFALGGLPASTIDYADLFSEDGRILTRITPERRAILAKLRANARFDAALQQYWYARSGPSKGTVSLSPPPTGQTLKWELRQMVSRGIVFAGKKAKAKPGNGHTIYKAENILSGEIYGEPQDEGIDIGAARNRYLFDALHIIPGKMWAVARIERSPNAVSFDPRSIAFTDTATVFVPRSDLSDFPFDLLFMSRVYRYYFALVCRMSYLNLYRGDVYPTNLRLLPWNDNLVALTSAIEKLRDPLLEACKTAYRTADSMREQLGKLPLVPLRDLVKASKSAKLSWSQSYSSAENPEVGEHLAIVGGEEGYRIQVSSQMFDWIEVTDEAIAKMLLVALSAEVGETLSRDEVLALGVPPTEEVASDFRRIVADHLNADLEAPIEQAIDPIDHLIGGALGLDKGDVEAIRRELVEDPFLRNIKPRYPASATRLHGYRTGLDSHSRYE